MLEKRYKTRIVLSLQYVTGCNHDPIYIWELWKPCMENRYFLMYLFVDKDKILKIYAEGIHMYGLMILLPIAFVVILLAICFSIVKSGNNFRDNSKQIINGMTKSQVQSIMGSPSFTKTHQDGSVEWVYEKSEWKGFLRGGTMTRRMEIVFNSSGVVISVGRNQNCDRSGW